jgi:transketolase
VTDKPSLICCRTTIGKGSKNQGSEKTHGAPLGKDDIRGVKLGLGLDPDATFVVPAEASAAFRQHDGHAKRLAWEARLAAHPRRDEFVTALQRDGAALAAKVQWPAFKAGDKIATRKASQSCLQAIIAQAPWVVGGSADLAGSNGTETKKPLFRKESFESAQTFAFGVREHGMAAICNGMALHGGVLPYCATFLVFHDYMRPSVRLACLMGAPVIYVYTHDSVFLGEDGPTHQPIEHLAALRTIPGMRTFRPSDATETAIGWQLALSRKDGPTALVLTRQNLPVFDRTALAPAEGALKGGYILVDADEPEVVLIATGSEVALALDAAKALAPMQVRVVSMPCVELFLQQDAVYRTFLLPPGVSRVSIEAGTTFGWERIVGDHGLCIGIDRFGASAPDKVLAEKFGFTAQAVAERVRAHFE